MKGMVWFVRACAAYNFSGALSFLIPGALAMLGVALPSSSFWLVLPAMFATFAGLALLFASRDLEHRASLAYWNGLVRLTFVVAVFAFGLGSDVGTFVKWLALGDVPLAIGAVFILPRVVRRGHGELLLGTA
ncbi:MAG: hypothetical protein QM817_36830 [Archangium sp.]